jgi:type IX secretion system PorP/SprF family membrane protein
MAIRLTKIIVTLFIAFPIAILSVFCQDVHYSNLHENLYKLNPSRITNTEKLSLYLTYRNQWPGTNDFISFDGGVFYSSDRLKSTAGIHVLNDNQGKGIINTTTISLLYGYKTKIGRQFDFSAGLNGNYNIYTANFSELQYENMGSPVIPSNESLNFFDFSAGIEFGIYEHTWIGLSVSHISNIASSSHLLLNRKFNFSYTGIYILSSSFGQQKVYAEPLVSASVQSNYNELLYGGRLFYEIIYGGIYLRQNIQFQMDALILLLGTTYKNWSFFYTYDINLSGADSRFTKLAAHEVTFLYNLEYKRKSNKKGAIKCPKI